MAKFIPDANLDAQLSVTEGDVINICSAQPTDFTEATSTFNLAAQAVVGGDYAKADGDVSGRKNTVTPPTGTDIDFSGTATHVAKTTASGSVLEEVSTCTSQALTAGGTVDITPYSSEMPDPA